MRKERFEFQNRHDLKIVGDIWYPQQSKGLAFVQHGTAHYRTRPQIERMADVLSRNGYTTVTFDSTHSFGESGGSLEKVTWTTHCDDLEDVMAWCETQSFYQAPFILAGHSSGGFSCLSMTIKHPDKVKAVAPLSTCISGPYTYEAYQKNVPEFELWKQQGFIERPDRGRPDIKAKISWAWIEDGMQYDLLKMASHITCPVLMIVGDKDAYTPAEHQKILYDALTCNKEFFIAPDCEHSFPTESNLQFLETHLEKWIQSLKP